MIPIGTDVRLRARPVGNYVLIGLNVAVMLASGVIPPQVLDAALPPLRASVPALVEYLTYQFRHGDLWHLAGNMLFLWIFGNAVCDRMGSLSYVLFYLAGGVFAGVAYAQLNQNPMVGASGSIAAVTTAFLVLYPRVHITILIWFFIITTVQLPAMILIVFKIILWDNIIAPGLDQGAVSNVAYSAHLGGYAFGFSIAMLMLGVRAMPRNQFDLLALWNRWLRRTGVDLPPSRHGYDPGEVTFGVPRARRVDASETDSHPLDDPPLAPHEQLREDILDRLSERDYEEAAHLYAQLAALRPPPDEPEHGGPGEGGPSTAGGRIELLPRDALLELANYLAQTQRHAAALEAYESFLRAYPTAHDAAAVRLLCGLIARRYLGDRERAVSHLQIALDALSNQNQRELADQELRLALGNPPAEE